MSGSKRFAAGVLLLALVGVASPASAQNAPSLHIRGTIDTFDGDTITVRPADGIDIAVKLAPSFTIVGVTKASLAEVTTGRYVGVATTPAGAGPLRALEIHTFPTEGRQFYGDWDLVPNGGMANGDVSAVVDQVKNNLLTLTIQGEPKQIIVPRGTPIVAFGPGDKSLLTPGAHVMVPAAKQADGSYSSRAVIVGVSGVVPPL